MNRVPLDFPGDLMAEMLPMQGAWVHSLIRELDHTCSNEEFTCHS